MNSESNSQESSASCKDVRESTVSAVQDEGTDHDDWRQMRVPGCTECQIHRRDPTPAELTMCLHAALYKVISHIIIML